jgi:hypothetical protein
MMRTLFSLSFLLLFLASAGQQISIPRVDEMPDLPQPYDMRDWKEVAISYDSLVFDPDASGTHLPLASIFTNTTNYPDHDALAIPSYVGTNSPPGKEAINVIPAVIGATLVGINKADQQGINWPLYCEEYFNRRPAENVYLNGPVTSSGNDWWYETMPNIFFYQLNALYPNTGDFNYQVTTLADRWLEAVYAMEGRTTPWDQPYMNYRAFKLSTMTPNAAGVKQPEAAGAIAWILYQAFTMTGEDKYRIGAELSLEFLNAWEDNPSYEIQLPYGVYIAARMNAELGTTYDIEKLVNWCFDRGNLRGWGVIVGDWNGIDMDGLIGEVNTSSPNYVFHMNSLEHVGALVPMVRYDDRYATAIAKWVLNAANASRFYYSPFLEDDMQDNGDWTKQYDLNGAIAYESLRQKTEGPYGTGDAMNGGWAQTNLGLYGSSHVGIFGAIIEKTNVEGILQLNLNMTDYYSQDAYPTHLYYNPYDEVKQVELDFQDAVFDIYDAISNQVIVSNATDIVNVDIPSKSSVMTVIIPAGSMINYALNHATVDDVIIDYNAGQTVENYPPRIKALVAEDTVAVAGSLMDIFCTAVDRESDSLIYYWSVNPGDPDTNSVLNWNVPEETGLYRLMCQVQDEGGLWAMDSVDVHVVEKINYPPVIEDFVVEELIIYFNGSTEVSCIASDANGDELTYEWTTSAGTIEGEGMTITYFAPAEVTNAYLVCEVTDTDNAKDIDSILILVRDPDYSQTGELIAQYGFNGNVNDKSGNNHHGNPTNVTYVDDMHGIQEHAIRYQSFNSMVAIPNDDHLNFQDGLTVSYWISVEDFFDRESYPVSHGNWTSRWKTSITDQKIRFTLNGSTGIIDVDADKALEKDKWVHVVALYNGMDCLVFLNGRLSGFKPYTGTINKTNYDLVFGQSLPDQEGFNFKGKMDKLRLYDYGISYEEVKEIYESELSSVGDINQNTQKLQVYPNPATDHISIKYKTESNAEVRVKLNDVTGNEIIGIESVSDQEGFIRLAVPIDNLESGIYILTVIEGQQSIGCKIIKTD